MTIVPKPCTDEVESPEDSEEVEEDAEEVELPSDDCAKVIILRDKPRIAISALNEIRAIVWRLDIRRGGEDHTLARLK